jgi:Tfp pilus assembly protein PilO
VTKRINGRLALLLAVAGVLVLLLAGWYTFVSPQRSKAAALDTQISDSNAKLEATQMFLRSPAAHDSVAKLRLLRVALPDDVEMSQILRQLAWAADESGVRLNSITPAVPGTSSTGAAVPISLTVSGHYFRISKFMHLLRTRAEVTNGKVKASGRLYAFDDMSFSGDDKGLVTGTLALDAFMYAPPAPPTSTSTTPGDSTTTGDSSTSTTTTTTTTTTTAGS